MTTAQLPIHRGSSVVRAMTLARNDMLVQVRDTARESDPGFPKAFGRLVDTIDATLRREEALMEMARYERAHAQRQDNALLLAALHHAVSRVEGGNLRVGREVVAALPDLLSLHRFAALRSLVARARRQGSGGGRPLRQVCAAVARQAGEGAR